MEVVEVMCWPLAGYLIRSNISISKRLRGRRVCSIKAIPGGTMNKYVAAFEAEKTGTERDGLFKVTSAI